jgi:hypothetical protein
MGMTDLTLVGRGPGTEDGEIALVRLLSLLPPRWLYAHRAGPSRIDLRVTTPGIPAGDVRAAVTTALADPALHRWHLLPEPLT